MEDQETKPVQNAEAQLPKPNISSIKNKLRRKELFITMKKDKKKLKKKEKKRIQEEREALGQDAPPKQTPKTIENQRVYDETMVNPEDEEVNMDMNMDTTASYFKQETTPKVLITTADRPSSATVRFCKELKMCIPESEIYYRRGLALKKIIPQAISRGYTDLVVINEDRQVPNGMIISHLPEGPTAHFKMSQVKFRKQIPKCGESTKHLPEVILNNFNTRLGHSVGRLFASLFPQQAQFQGRRVVTLHNQRDFIFFRHHRYQFRNEKRCGLHELGPRFTLKLRSLQKGTFDSKFGEYEWVHKRHDQETSRRKFFL